MNGSLTVSAIGSFADRQVLRVAYGLGECLMMVESGR